MRFICFFFSSRRRHTRYWRDWSSDVCSSDLRGESGTEFCVVFTNPAFPNIFSYCKTVQASPESVPARKPPQLTFRYHKLYTRSLFKTFLSAGKPIARKPLRWHTLFSPQQPRGNR